MIRRIISGGQPGAARAALDWALQQEILHGGWCPRGRKVLDGVLPPQYDLAETKSHRYLEAKERNVETADGTVIFTLEPDLKGNSLKTAEFAKQHGKPWLHISGRSEDASRELRDFVEEHGIQSLNVAGSRESEEISIYLFVEDVLRDAFGEKGAPGYQRR